MNRAQPRAPLRHTRSGLVIASPDSGFRVGCFITDIPGVFTISAAEQPEQLREDWQRFVDGAEPYFAFTDPTLGEENTLTREMIPHVVGIVTGYSQKVHPSLRALEGEPQA